MTEQSCPLHHVPDECLHNARRGAEAGHLGPAPNTPEPRAHGLPPVPAASVSLELIAKLINTWGTTVIDPTIPEVDPADTRTVRYSLQALSEASVSRPGRSIAASGLGGHYLPWSRVHDALSQAHLTAYGTAHPFADEKSTALTWYITLRQVEFARWLWAEHIAPDESEDLLATPNPG